MYYPPTAQGDLLTAKRAPEALQGLEWVVSRSDACPGGWTDPGTTLRARSVPLGPPCTRVLGMPPPHQ